MNAAEIRRVSTTVIAWLDDPSSVPKDQPHCQWCNSPKRDRDRNRRCEVCGQLGYVTGRQPDRGNVFVEHYKPRRVIRIRRKKNASAD